MLQSLCGTHRLAVMILHVYKSSLGPISNTSFPYHIALLLSEAQITAAYSVAGSCDTGTEPEGLLDPACSSGLGSSCLLSAVCHMWVYSSWQCTSYREPERDAQYRFLCCTDGT